MKHNGLKEKLKAGFPSCNSAGYFDSYKENIYKNQMDQNYQKMFDKGSGGELHSKAEAIHSSSMLSYNLFHWIKDDSTFTFEGVTYSKVYFEVQMRTLICRSNPANMDVVLEGIDNNGKRHLLFIESKFTEYYSNCRFEISESYSKETNWYNKKIEWRGIILTAKKMCNKCYGEGIKQTITHLFGIYSLYGDGKALRWFNENNGQLMIEDINKVEIHFANFIFEPQDKDFHIEHEKFRNYIQLYSNFIRELPKVIAEPKIEITIMSYSEVWKKMKTQIRDTDLTEYIELRYMKFAQM